MPWLAAPQEIVQILSSAKQAADLQASTFNQMLAYEVSKDGFIGAHLERVRA